MERRLDPRMRVVWTIELAIAATFVTTVALIGCLLIGIIPLPALAIAALAAAYTWWFPRARYDRWSFELAPTTLELRYGIFLRAEFSVPYFRVQHVEIEQGPIERRLGVAKLRLKTASPHTTVPLPGVALADATDLRQTILERAGGNDAV